MANTLVTSTIVLKEVARKFVNDLKFLANVNRSYDPRFKGSATGGKPGDTVSVRLPQLFTATDGDAFQPQALYDQTVPITLTNKKGVHFGYSSTEATLQLEDITRRYIDPAATTLANAAEVLSFNQVYPDIYSVVGTPGTTPSATVTYLQAGTKITDLAAPLDGRIAMLDPLAMQTIANTSSTLFNPSAAIANNWRSGMFGANQLGIAEWYQDVNRPVHTTGTYTSCSPTVNGANQTGSTLNTQAWASGATTLNRGDIFTVAGVFTVNPVSKQSTGRLQQFVVTATTSDSSGNMTALPISPSIITSGQLQTVSGSPASGAVITVLGATSPTSGTLATTTSPQSFIYHPDAFAFAMADLATPNGGAKATFVQDDSLGISIRMAEQWNISNDQNGTRLDILIGAATLQARLACRVMG